MGMLPDELPWEFRRIAQSGNCSLLIEVLRLNLAAQESSDQNDWKDAANRMAQRLQDAGLTEDGFTVNAFTRPQLTTNNATKLLSILATCKELSPYNAISVVIDFLINSFGAHVETEDEDNNHLTVLQQAVTRGSPSMVSALLLYGNADWQKRFTSHSTYSPDEKFDYHEGETLLHAAASRGDVPIMRLLVDRGASVNDHGNGTDWSRTPLHAAVKKGRTEAVAFLLDHEANVDNRAEEGKTALHVTAGAIATRRDTTYERIAALLLAHGANPNAVDTYGETPLHKAAREGNVDIMRTLLDHGALPTARSNRSKTPFFYAAQQTLRSPEQCRYMINLLKSYNTYHAQLCETPSHDPYAGIAPLFDDQPSPQDH